MSNLAIGYQNRADDATLAGGAWSVTLPLDNLKDRVQAKVARTRGAALTFTADASTDILTISAGHGLVTGDPVTVENSGGGLPDGLTAGTVYFARALSLTTVSLHTSSAGASANTGVANMTTNGTGTHSLRASTNMAATRLRADLGASYSLRCLCLANHNLSAAARWRVRLGAAALDLDFTDGVLDSRITFTRATAATRVNARGYREEVASGQARFDYNPSTLACKGLLIEEARTNLLLNSNNFRNNTDWIKGSSSISTYELKGPSGGMSAAIWQATSVATPALAQSVTKDASARTYTASLYVLAGTHTGAFSISIDDGTTTNRVRVQFNLTTLSISTTVAEGTFSNALSWKLDAEGGMTRFAVSGTTSTGTTVRMRCYWTAAAVTDYVYIDNAQLEEGAFPTSYMPSNPGWTGRTSSGSYVNASGLIASAGSGNARYSYNPALMTERPVLLVEPAATNLLLRSEELDNASWTKTNTTINANAATAPDGATTADAITHTGATPGVAQTSAAFTAGDIVVVSVFAKQFATGTHLRIQLGGLCSAWFNLATGAVGTNDAGSGNVTFMRKGIHTYSNGWYRCILVVQTSVITTLSVNLGACSADNTAPASGQSALLWGAQAESGTNVIVTSYIATTSATVTRNADTSTSTAATRNAEDVEMTSTNFSAWYTAGQGTLYADFARPVAVSQLSRVLALTDGTANNKIYIGTSAGNNLVTEITTGGVDQAMVQFLAGVGANGTAYKQAMSYAPNDIAESHAGGAVGTDTVAAIPTVDRLKLGSQNSNYYLNGTLARVAYWPTARSDAELQSLTTSGPGAIDYDSGWVNALQMTLTNSLTDWGANYALIAATSAAVTARYVQIELDDRANSAGYLEAGRLFVGGAMQPAANASYGLRDGWSDELSTITQAQGGARYVTARRRLRQVQFALDFLEHAEARELHELQMLAGLTEEVLYIPDPADAAASQRYGFLGSLEQLDSIEWPWPTTRSAGFRIKELA